MPVHSAVVITNAVFAANNATFVAACKAAGVKPTARQASKYRRGVGSAYPWRSLLKGWGY
tara:strand:+ start:431 stop:610 length:180 start_codon:yes stop_codon:yes gene_type:complete